MTTERHMEVAQEIKRQLGPAFCVMTGARDFVASTEGLGRLTFRLPRNGHNVKRINIVRITLEVSDTYTVRFERMRLDGDHMPTFELIAERSDVYNEDLRAVFTAETNLMTSFNR